MKLTVIGIGYNKGDITAEGAAAIKNADTVIVKSARYDLPECLDGVGYTALDYVYERAESFTALDAEIAREVERLSKKNTVYLVSGNGVTDNSLKYLQNYKLIKGVTLVPGGVYNSYALMSAYEIADTARLNINTDIPLIVTEIDNCLLAGDVKIKLLDFYAEDTRTEFNGKDGILENLDRNKKYNYSSHAVIYPAGLLKKKRYNVNDLIVIMDMLCGEGGCPWDKVQTHESIKINLIEEAYEAVDAIDSGDFSKMSEEFGDVLLQSVFQSAIAERAGEFNFSDVVSGLCDKIITRHTHVFGEVKAGNPDGALSAWDAAKSKEKGQKTVTDSINDVPDIFPALLRAVKVQGRAKKGGMDFSGADTAMESLMNEINEFNAARDYEEKYGEMGDILFSVCNVARHNKIQPETALNSSIAKFNRRFKYVEDKIIETGREMKSVPAEELDTLWQESKKHIF